MSRYVNYIYLTISETTIKSFKKTNYGTYHSYCMSLAKAVADGNFSKREKRDVIAIFRMLNKVFSMETNETANHVLNYLELDSDKHTMFYHAANKSLEYATKFNMIGY